jgi:SAM-dependent methyltransferase
MNLFAPARCFDPNDPELLDLPGLDRTSLREELQMLEELNRRLNGHKLMIAYVQRLLGSISLPSLSVLDLGTGAADVPRAIAAWARERQLPVTITAVDRNPEVLQIAKELCRDWPEIQLIQHDLRSLPYAPGSFDLVLCSLALHHFDSVDAIMILQQIKKMARIGYIVSDLRRNWFAIGAMELLLFAMFRSRVFRHDARQSCRAAFTVRELWALAEQAGLDNYHIHRHHWFFRMVMAGQNELRNK